MRTRSSEVRQRLLSPLSMARTGEGKGWYRSGLSHAVTAFLTEILKEAFVLVPKVVLENRNGCKLGEEKPAITEL